VGHQVLLRQCLSPQDTSPNMLPVTVMSFAGEGAYLPHQLEVEAQNGTRMLVSDQDLHIAVGVDCGTVAGRTRLAIVPWSAPVSTVARHLGLLPEFFVHHGVPLHPATPVLHFMTPEHGVLRYRPPSTIALGGAWPSDIRNAFIGAVAERIFFNIGGHRDDFEPELLRRDDCKLKLPHATTFIRQWLADKEHTRLGPRLPTLKNLQNKLTRELDSSILKLVNRMISSKKREMEADGELSAPAPTIPLSLEEKVQAAQKRKATVDGSDLGRLMNKRPMGSNSRPTADIMHDKVDGPLPDATVAYLQTVLELYKEWYVLRTGNKVTWRASAPQSLWIMPPHPVLSGQHADPDHCRRPPLQTSTARQ